ISAIPRRRARSSTATGSIPATAPTCPEEWSTSPGGRRTSSSAAGATSARTSSRKPSARSPASAAAASRCPAAPTPAAAPHAVWWQFLRLVVAGLAPQLRRGLRVARGMLFAAWAWLAFFPLFLLLFVHTWLVPGMPAWRMGGKCARLYFRLLGIPLVVRGL